MEKCRSPRLDFSEDEGDNFFRVLLDFEQVGDGDGAGRFREITPDLLESSLSDMMRK